MTFIINPYRFGAAWTPAEFPSLTGWWSMKRSPGLPGAGNAINSWEEVSPGTDTWGPIGAGNVPFQFDLNGQPSADFTAPNSEAMDITATLSTMFGNTGLVAVVFSALGNPTSQSFSQFWEANSVIADSGGNWGIALNRIGGVNRIRCGIYDGSERVISFNLTLDATLVVMMWQDGSQLHASLNGVEGTPVDAGATDPQTGVMRIGVNYENKFFNGYTHELVLSTDSSDADNRALLEAYLQAEWGL